MGGMLSSQDVSMSVTCISMLTRTRKACHPSSSAVISFIIPAHNEEGVPWTHVERFASRPTGSPWPYEIMVVNDASPIYVEVARQNGARVITSTSADCRYSQFWRTGRTGIDCSFDADTDYPLASRASACEKWKQAQRRRRNGAIRRSCALTLDSCVCG